MRAKTHKTPRVKQRGTSSWPCIYVCILHVTPQAWGTKEKINWTLSELKTFAHKKTSGKWIDNLQDREKLFEIHIKWFNTQNIFTNHVLRLRIQYPVYIKNTYSSTTKRQPNLKNGQRIQIAISTKIHKWLKRYWKSLVIREMQIQNHNEIPIHTH